MNLILYDPKNLCFLYRLIQFYGIFLYPYVPVESPPIERAVENYRALTFAQPSPSSIMNANSSFVHKIPTFAD